MATIEELRAAIERRKQPAGGSTIEQLQASIARRQQQQPPVQQALVAPQPQAQPGQQPVAPQPTLAAERFGPGAVRPELPGLETVLEPAAAIASGIVAEPVAGLAGIGTAIAQGPEAGAQAVEATREALTFQPRTEQGRAGLQAVGEALEPIGQAVEAAEKVTGDIGFELAGPVGGAIGATIPTAVLTAFGIKRTPRGAPDITPQRAREIEQVISASQKRGVDVLTSDIFEPKSIFSRLSQQFAERIPFVGTGGKRATQQTQRIKALEELDQSIPRVEVSDIFSSLEANANKVRVAAGKRINDTSTQMTALGEVQVASTINKIDDALARLQRPGKIENPELIRELENLKQTAQEAGASFDSLREFRTDARAIVEKVDPSGRSQLRTTDKALMDSVITGITSDLDNFVRTNLGMKGFRRYKEADKIYAQEARKLTKSRLKTVLDKGDVKPELINNLLFSSSPSEVNLLFKNLDSAGRQNARFSLYRRALDSSTRGGEISPQRFVTELGKLEKNFNTFFRGADRAELQGLKKLLETTRRAGESPVTTPTGQALLIPGAVGGVAAAAVGTPAAIVALLGASTIGLGARIFESAGVRNMLIQLGKAPKRSTLEADLRKTIPLLLEQSSREIAREEQVR